MEWHEYLGVLITVITVLGFLYAAMRTQVNKAVEAGIKKVTPYLVNGDKTIANYAHEAKEAAQDAKQCAVEARDAALTAKDAALDVKDRVIEMHRTLNGQVNE